MITERLNRIIKRTDKWNYRQNNVLRPADRRPITPSPYEESVIFSAEKEMPNASHGTNPSIGSTHSREKKKNTGQENLIVNPPLESKHPAKKRNRVQETPGEKIIAVSDNNSDPKTSPLPPPRKQTEVRKITRIAVPGSLTPVPPETGKIVPSVLPERSVALVPPENNQPNEPTVHENEAILRPNKPQRIHESRKKQHIDPIPDTSTAKYRRPKTQEEDAIMMFPARSQSVDNLNPTPAPSRGRKVAVNPSNQLPSKDEEKENQAAQHVLSKADRKSIGVGPIGYPNEDRESSKAPVHPVEVGLKPARPAQMQTVLRPSVRSEANEPKNEAAPAPPSIRIEIGKVSFIRPAASGKKTSRRRSPRSHSIPAPYGWEG